MIPATAAVSKILGTEDRNGITEAKASARNECFEMLLHAVPFSAQGRIDITADACSVAFPHVIGRSFKDTLFRILYTPEPPRRLAEKEIAAMIGAAMAKAEEDADMAGYTPKEKAKAIASAKAEAIASAEAALAGEDPRSSNPKSLLDAAGILVSSPQHLLNILGRVAVMALNDEKIDDEHVRSYFEGVDLERTKTLIQELQYEWELEGEYRDPLKSGVNIFQEVEDLEKVKDFLRLAKRAEAATVKHDPTEREATLSKTERRRMRDLGLSGVFKGYMTRVVDQFVKLILDIFGIAIHTIEVDYGDEKAMSLKSILELQPPVFSLFIREAIRLLNHAKEDRIVQALTIAMKYPGNYGRAGEALMIQDVIDELNQPVEGQAPLVPPLPPTGDLSRDRERERTGITGGGQFLGRLLEIESEFPALRNMELSVQSEILQREERTIPIMRGESMVPGMIKKFVDILAELVPNLGNVRTLVQVLISQTLTNHPSDLLVRDYFRRLVAEFGFEPYLMLGAYQVLTSIRDFRGINRDATGRSQFQKVLDKTIAEAFRLEGKPITPRAEEWRVAVHNSAMVLRMQGIALPRDAPLFPIIDTTGLPELVREQILTHLVAYPYTGYTEASYTFTTANIPDLPSVTFERNPSYHTVRLRAVKLAGLYLFYIATIISRVMGIPIDELSGDVLESAPFLNMQLNEAIDETVIRVMCLFDGRIINNFVEGCLIAGAGVLTPDTTPFAVLNKHAQAFWSDLLAHGDAPNLDMFVQTEFAKRYVVPLARITNRDLYRLFGDSIFRPYFTLTDIQRSQALQTDADSTRFYVEMEASQQ